MTGLHGLHIVIGILILAVMLFMVSKKTGKTGTAVEEEFEGLHIKMENSGLYWHLVDIIWIFLFPLFYLIT
jgi:cytochrome c oxidase subunit 3